MEAFSTETRYKKMSGFATTKGQMFEVKLSALLFLRGINSGLQFQLASNVAGAGALDDVVFRLKSKRNPGTWTTCFVQLKHKENSRISCKMLTDPKGNFSLQKYCESYIEIKQAMSLEDSQVLFDGTLEDCTVVIYSNAQANKDLGVGHCAVSGSIDAFLESDSGNMFSFDRNRNTDVDKAVFGCLEKFGFDGSDFLSRLRIFCGQPSESELNFVIKDELQKVNDRTMSYVDSERLCECFLENVSVWCERSDFILHPGSDILVRARDRVIVETCSTRDKGNYHLDVYFEKTALLSLRGVLNEKFSVIYLESSEESSLLSPTKLLQAVEGSYLFLDYLSLKVHSSSVAAEWKLGRYGMLILVVNESDMASTDNNYLGVLMELHYSSALLGKKIVILAHAMTLVKEKLSCLPESHTTTLKDTFEFSQITIESQNKLLDTNFWLQGQQVSLKAFVDGQNFDQILSASSFIEIAKSGGNFQIGSEFTDQISYYIARTLNQTNELATTLFQISKLPDSFLILFSSTQDLYAVLHQGDSSTANHQRVLKTLKKISEAPLVRNHVESIVSHGENVKLKSLTCSRVSLRHGEANEVTALRIRPRADNSINGWILFVDKSVAESDAAAMLQPNTRHFLSLENGKLEWIRSRTDSMDVIRDHVDENQVSEVVTETVTDIKERLVLLSAEPGMGKSTLLSRFAKKTKEALPNYWVVSIALNDHTRLFAGYKHSDAFEFLVRAIGVESHLQRSMLAFALNVTGNVVILLDGFDEIAPTYVSECRLLLSNLLATKAKRIWITSRNSIKVTLEDHLSTLATKLRKFTVADQRLFFRLYWKAEREAAFNVGKDIIDDDSLDDFVGKLIEMTSTAISDREKDFMSIPLQTRMMAEVFGDHVIGAATECVLPEKLDLLSLLDRFVEKKLGIYVRDKLRVSVEDTNYYVHLDVHRKAYVGSHMEAALFLILGENDVEKLHLQTILRNSATFFEKIGRGEDKTGIIDCVVNGKPRFIHRVFAEYFVARWFAEHFLENSAFLAGKLFTLGFRVVRDIFDRLLAANLPLHTAVLDENLDAILTSLSSANVRDVGGRTPLHLAAALGTDNAKQEAIIRALVGPGSNVDLSIGSVGEVDSLDDLFAATPLWYADATLSYTAIDALLKHGADPKHIQNTRDQSVNVQAIEFAIERDLDSLIAFWLDNGLAVERAQYSSERRLLTVACEKGSVRVAQLLMARGANIASVKKREYPPLYVACKHGHVALVELLCDASERNTEAERKSWLAFLRNVFSRRVDARRRGRRWRTRRVPWIDFFWNKLVPITVARPTFLDTTTSDDGIRETALHVAVRENRLAVIRHLISRGAEPCSKSLSGETALHLAAKRGLSEAVAALLESVDEGRRYALVKDVDRFGNTALHLAAKSLATLKILSSAGGSLTATNFASRTTLMIAAETNTMDVVEFVVREFMATHESDAARRAEHLNARDKTGATAIYLAAKSGYKKVVAYLLQEGAELRSLGSSPLRVAVKRGEVGVVRTLLGAVVERDRAEFVHEESALVLAVETGRRDLIDILVAVGADVKIASAEGQTTLMVAAATGYLDIVDFLLKTFENDVEKLSFVNASSKSYDSAVHAATANEHLNVVRLLIANGADVKLRTAHMDHTPLHVAAGNSHADLMRTLIAAVAKSERVAYVNAADVEGCSALHRAVAKGGLEAVEVLVIAGAKLALKTCNGETALLLAVSWGHREVVRFLLDEFSAERETVGKVEYINERDRKGRSALTEAERRGWHDGVDQIKEVLLREGFVQSRWERCVLS